MEYLDENENKSLQRVGTTLAGTHLEQGKGRVERWQWDALVILGLAAPLEVLEY